MTIAELTASVRDWMRDFGQEAPETIQTPSDEVIRLRCRLIREENLELFEARTDAERLDAIADLLVVVVGAAADIGIKPETLQAHLVDVLKANDEKKWTPEQVAERPSGWGLHVIPWSDRYAVRDPSGKIRKPPGWTAPDPQRHIDAQRSMEG
jgi:predicted HAD superfamily Cof-like phosphohydrolase